MGGGLRKVTLSVPEGAPGSELEVGVELDVTREVKVSSAEIRVRCVEHAWVQQGDRRVRENVVVVEERYPVALPPAVDAPLSKSVKIRVPASASPAMHHSLHNEVDLALNLPWRPDLLVKAVLVVLPPQVPRPAQAAPSPLDTDTEVWSTIARPQYRPGDTVTGEVKVMPISKAQHARSLVVRLTAVAHNWGEENRQIYAEAEAKGPFPEDVSVPFSLKLPADAPLTYRGQNLDIDWYVDAELLDTPGLNPRSHTPFVVG